MYYLGYQSFLPIFANGLIRDGAFLILVGLTTTLLYYFILKALLGVIQKLSSLKYHNQCLLHLK
jgi:hypothetical protein